MRDQVWKYKVESHDSIKTDILYEIDRSPGMKMVEDRDSIFKADYTSGDSLHNRPYFKIFENAIIDFFDVVQDHYCVSIFDVTNMWYQQYHKNDIHDWHFHPETSIGFVYLLELPDPKYSTEFFDINERKRFQLECEEGDILVFPGYAPHRSPLIDSDCRKTIISGNLSFLRIYSELID